MRSGRNGHRQGMAARPIGMVVIEYTLMVAVVGVFLVPLLLDFQASLSSLYWDIVDALPR